MRQALLARSGTAQTFRIYLFCGEEGEGRNEKEEEMNDEGVSHGRRNEKIGLEVEPLGRRRWVKCRHTEERYDRFD